MDTDLLRSAQSGMSRKGKSLLIKHLKGERLTQRQAIWAKCYDCDGMGDSGFCDMKDCSLYPYSPYTEIISRTACGSSPSTKERILKGGLK